MKILIIDDDQLIRMTCCNILKNADYDALEADNGNTGLAIFAKERPDLVIIDMLMPEKEGLETISEIRAIDPEAKIIAISSGGSTRNMSFLQLAKKVGADHALQKPFKPAVLLSAIKTLMNV
jgi:DNA-binding response OmpR family regulator